MDRLFVVVLGGRTTKSNIELHDIRWVIGKNIEDTFPQLRKEWFGLRKGLHIDSYLELKFIDGYEIIVYRKDNESAQINYKGKIYDEDTKLWLVNLGGYHPDKLLEIHEIQILAAKNSREAKEKAKKRWDSQSEKIHKDDIRGIHEKRQIENSILQNKFEDWIIRLKKDPKERNQIIKPDWYGYMRIDKE